VFSQTSFPSISERTGPSGLHKACVSDVSGLLTGVCAAPHNERADITAARRSERRLRLTILTTPEITERFPWWRVDQRKGPVSLALRHALLKFREGVFGKRNEFHNAPVVPPNELRRLDLVLRSDETPMNKHGTTMLIARRNRLLANKTLKTLLSHGVLGWYSRRDLGRSDMFEQHATSKSERRPSPRNTHAGRGISRHDDCIFDCIIGLRTGRKVLYQTARGGR
jgi:hypothetical protein